MCHPLASSLGGLRSIWGRGPNPERDSTLEVTVRGQSILPSAVSSQKPPKTPVGKHGLLRLLHLGTEGAMGLRIGLADMA